MERDVSKKQIASIISDIDTFAKACNVLGQPGIDSIADVANAIGMSPTGLSSCFKRLNREYGVPLVETHPRMKGFVILDSGLQLLKRSQEIFDIQNSIKDDIVNTYTERRKLGEVIKVSVSPYLLAQVFPQAAATFQSSNSHMVRIECEEGYVTDKVLNRLTSREIDIAILWNYPEKLEAAKLVPKVTCVKASRSLDAVVVFGKEHQKYKYLHETEQYACVYIEDLGTERLFLLDSAHQPLYADIPQPNILQRGDRVNFSTFVSIISSIRAGKIGVGILPAIYKDIDRYKKDGSLYFLPLKSRYNSNLKIEIIYLFLGPKISKWKSEEILAFNEFNINDNVFSLLTESKKEFLRYIDGSVMNDLSSTSGWNITVSPNLTIDPATITEFKHSYHISPSRLGHSVPRWKHSRLSLSHSAADGVNTYSGEMILESTEHAKQRIYNVAGEFVDNKILSLVSRLSEPFTFMTNELAGKNTEIIADTFVSCFNFLSSDQSFIMGVGIGQDDSGDNALICTEILSKEAIVYSRQVVEELQAMKNRTLIRTDVNASNSKKDEKVVDYYGNYVI